MKRRTFLRRAVATGALLMATRATRLTAFALNGERHFAPVKVSRDRLIREVVGLDHDDWSLAPNPDQTNEILSAHSEIMKGLRA